MSGWSVLRRPRLTFCRVSSLQYLVKLQVNTFKNVTSMLRPRICLPRYVMTFIFVYLLVIELSAGGPQSSFYPTYISNCVSRFESIADSIHFKTFSQILKYSSDLYFVLAISATFSHLSQCFLHLCLSLLLCPGLTCTHSHAPSRHVCILCS